LGKRKNVRKGVKTEGKGVKKKIEVVIAVKATVQSEKRKIMPIQNKKAIMIQVNGHERRKIT